MQMRIYLDNAATTPLLPEVISVMSDIMVNDFGNPSSIHAHGRKARTIIENARRIIARAIGASLSEVFFTCSATEANNMVLKNAVLHKGIRRIITTPIEHHCVLHSIDYLTYHGHCEVQYVRINGLGLVDQEHLKSLLSDNSIPTLVSIMHANNEIGIIQDIQAIGDICRIHGAFLHSDTVQTFGKIPLDVQKMGVHYISGSAHKLHGPKGVGFVYIHSEAMLPPFIHGGSQERNMRAGTENVIGIGGFGLAVDEALRHMETRRDYILNLKNRFKTLLSKKISDVVYLGESELTDSLYTIINVSLPPTPKDDLIIMNMDIAGISVSSGSACTSGIEQESHVLKAIYHDQDRPSVRFSFSHLNTLPEIEIAAQKLSEVL